MIHYPFDPDWATRSAREFTEYVAPLLPSAGGGRAMK